MASNQEQQQSQEQAMGQLKQEIANAYAQELFTTVRDKCFAKCVEKPGSSLSSGEANCLARCCDRYLDATRVVAQTVVQLSKKQAQDHGGGESSLP